MYGQISDAIISKVNLVDKIIDDLGLPRKEVEEITDEEDIN